MKEAKRILKSLLTMSFLLATSVFAGQSGNSDVGGGGDPGGQSGNKGAGGGQSSKVVGDLGSSQGFGGSRDPIRGGSSN